MSTPQDGAPAPKQPPAPAGEILDLDGLAAHYGIGRTKAFELVAEPGFPVSVVAGMHRYPAEAIRARDLAVSLAGTPADPARAAAGAATPPPKAKPGPKPAPKREAA